MPDSDLRGSELKVNVDVIRVVFLALPARQ
jgi:hypothetical protein